MAATIRVKNPNLGGEKWITIPTKILSEADHIVTNKGQGDLYLSNDGTYKDVIKSANDYTDKLIELITGSSPDILETLKELSNQTSDNKDFINVLNKSIATKLDKTANAVSASKLATPIKLWGNDFDGSLSIYGNLCAPNGNLGLGINTNNVVLGNSTNPSYIYGSSIMFKTRTDAVTAYISYDGKVGIGTANPLNALDVIGTGYFYTHLYCPIVIESSKNTVGIKFISSDTSDGLYLLANDKNFYITDDGWTTAHKIWHEGNLNPFNLSGNTLKLGKSTNLNLSYAELVSIASESSDNGVALRYWKTRDYLGSYSGIQIDSRGIWYDKTGGTLYKIWNEDNDGPGSGLDADTLDGLLAWLFLRIIDSIDDVNNTNLYKLYSFITDLNSRCLNVPLGFSSGEMIYIAGYDTGFMLVSSYTKDELIYRRGTNSLSTNTIINNDWKTIAFTDSTVANATKAYALLSNAASGNVDANKIVTANCYMLYTSYMGNESTNVPVANAYLNGLLSFGLHPNGTTAQLYISKDNPLYYRSSVTNDWKELTTSDGYYKDMRVGLADDLGDMEEKVEEEYIIQPTANTNEIRDGYAHIDSLKGNSIVWNLLVDTSLLRSTGEHNGITYTFSNNEIIANGTSSGISFGDSALGLIRIEAIEGHKYYVGYGGGSPGCYIQIYSSKSGNLIFNGSENNKECISTCPSTLDDWLIRIRISSGITVTYLKFKYSLIDLTKMFGSGNEPTTIEEFYNRIPSNINLYSYNEGEIINFNADSIKSVGFNQWDEEWEVGDIKFADGADYDSSLWIRNKGYIPVVPNNYYFIRKSDAIKTNAYLYDEHKNYIKYIELVANRTIFVELAKFIRFASYESTYNNDICINISNPDKNGTYEPYKEFVRQLPTNLFEGGMKSAGDAHDEIYWDKNKKKYIKVTRVGSVDLGSLDWEYDKANRFIASYKNDMKITSYYSPNILSAYGYYGSGYPIHPLFTNLAVAYYGGKIYLYNDAYTSADTFKIAMQGVMLNYELAEPIIEELDIPYMDYEVSNDGTERIESSTPSTPIKASVTYNFDAVNTIKLNRFDVSTIKENMPNGVAKSTSKLAKPVKIWGNEFDGTQDLDHNIYLVNNSLIHIRDNQNLSTNILTYNSNNLLSIGYGSSAKGHYTDICGHTITFRTNTSHDNSMFINSNGNVGIGTAVPLYKLDVNGAIYSNDGISIANSKYYQIKDVNGTSCGVLSISEANQLVFGYGTAARGYDTYLLGNSLLFKVNTTNLTSMVINSSGNVTIGSSDLTGNSYKLWVNGSTKINGHLIPHGTNAKHLGSESEKWQFAYIGNRVFVGNTENKYSEVCDGSLELHHNTPFIDFHFNNSTEDYTSRIIESAAGKLKCIGSWDVTNSIGIGDSLFVQDQIAMGELVDWYGVSWSEDSSDPTCTRIGNMALHRSLPILNAMRGYLITVASLYGEIISPLSDNWSELTMSINPNDRNNINYYGNAANTMVKIPEFWYIDDYEPSTKTHNLKISQTAKAGWCHHKEAYVGAYEGWSDGTYYLSRKHKIPTVSVSRTALRPLVRANGYEDEYKWNIYTYEEHRAICHLFLVEYATRNSQAPVNTALTSDGFKQGGLGSGCTTGAVTINGQETYSFIPTGTTDSLGNGSGQVAYTVTLTDADGNEIGTVTRYVNRYRGIENPFGHIWKYVDDIVNVYNAETTYKTVYKCNKPEHFATNKNNKYKPLCSFPGGSKMQGWSKEIKATINCDFFKYSVGGSESTYWCDYNYDLDDTSEHCLLIGGRSGSGGTAGLFCLSLASGVSRSDAGVGSRLTYLPWAE